MPERLTREQADAVDMRMVAAEVGAVLPDGPWTVDAARDVDDGGDRPAHYATLSRADGARLTLYRDGYRQRISIGGDYPRDAKTRDSFEPTRYENGSRVRAAEPITVGLARPADKIAADVKRRFLAPYLAAYAEAVKRRDETNAKDSEAAALALKIAETMGTDLRGPSQYRPETDWTIYDDGAEFKVSRYGGVTLTVRTSDGALAVELARLLRRMRKGDA